MRLKGREMINMVSCAGCNCSGPSKAGLQAQKLFGLWGMNDADNSGAIEKKKDWQFWREEENFDLGNTRIVDAPYNPGTLVVIDRLMDANYDGKIEVVEAKYYLHHPDYRDSFTNSARYPHSIIPAEAKQEFELSAEDEFAFLLLSLDGIPNSPDICPGCVRGVRVRQFGNIVFDIVNSKLLIKSKQRELLAKARKIANEMLPANYRIEANGYVDWAIKSPGLSE